MGKIAILMFLGGELVAQTSTPAMTELLQVLGILAIPLAVFLNAMGAYYAAKAKVLGEANKALIEKTAEKLEVVKTSVDGHTSVLTEKIAGLENTVTVLTKVAGGGDGHPMSLPQAVADAAKSVVEGVKQAVTDQSVSQQVVEKQIVQEVVREKPKKDK